MKRSLLTLPLFSLALACGGGSATQDTQMATPAPPPPTASPAAAPEAPNPHQGVIWYVYWEGIHCLTVYPDAGLIRSEESHNANTTFSSRNPHFSIISNYFEREDEWTPVIEAATSVDDLLDRLRAMQNVEVEQASNPVQTY